MGARGEIDPAVLAERLLLLVYAYGTNAGVRAVAAGDHGHSEDDLRYTRRRYFTVPACPEVARALANATFAARQAWLWGEGTTAVASDSTGQGSKGSRYYDWVLVTDSIPSSESPRSRSITTVASPVGPT